VVALERLLDKEKSPRVRVAVVRALVEQYAAGQDRAVRQVVEILFDADENPELRDAALGLLPLLPASERRGILRRLCEDPSTELSSRVKEVERAHAAPVNVTATVQKRIRHLASDDYAIWNKAVHRLSDIGEPAVGPLIEEMQRRAHDPEYCARAGMVLKGLGPRRGRCLAAALDRVEEPLPLQVLVEVAGDLGDKSLIYRLKDLIDRIARNRAVPADRDGFDPMQRVRAKAHLELARVGSRLAIADLRDALSDPRRRLEPEMVAAVERIGKKDEIPDLLRAYLREDRFLRDRVVVAVRAIMKRERIRRNNRMFHSLSPRQLSALVAILPPVRTGRTAPRRKPER
jgi:HEAT repeat protein